MGQIAIEAKDRRQVDEIIRFVKNFAMELPVEARFVLAIEMGRLFKPEIDELKRKQGDPRQNVEIGTVGNPRPKPERPS